MLGFCRCANNPTRLDQTFPASTLACAGFGCSGTHRCGIANPRSTSATPLDGGAEIQIAIAVVKLTGHFVIFQFDPDESFDTVILEESGIASAFKLVVLAAAPETIIPFHRWAQAIDGCGRDQRSRYRFFHICDHQKSLRWWLHWRPVTNRILHIRPRFRGLRWRYRGGAQRQSSRWPWNFHTGFPALSWS